MDLLQTIKDNAKKLKKRIVLPESADERTLKAAEILLGESIAEVTLIGDEKDIKATADKLGLKSLNKALIMNPKNHAKKDAYIETLFDLRKEKGLTKDEAAKLIENPLYLGVMSVKCGDADGEVAGAMNTTGDVFRPALQIIKTRPGISIVSSCFIMILKDTQFGDNGMVVFADCALNTNPSEKELADIAIASADTARIIAGMNPRVAMLSFSTKGSAKDPLALKVKNATEIVKNLRPDLQVDGEMQADAALIEAVGKSKAPGSTVAGKANVLIFPDLNAGNIGYKLVQRLAHAEAVGPISQGLAKPVNDLSRGCSVEDIVNVAAITANLASLK